MANSTLFDRVGGMDFFVALVDRFYDGVERDVVLRLLYPDDLTESRRHLALFLAQYWGGPSTYQEERGHPRLRMRHAPFVIDDDARERWLTHMTSALAAMTLSEDDRDALAKYLVMAAHQLQNS